MKSRKCFFVFIKISVPTQKKKNSALDVISMNFVHFIDPDLFGIAFAGILSQRMRTLKNHKCHLMQREIKKLLFHES